MAEILCPCGCGIRFEPVYHGGSKQKHATVACGDRVRQRRKYARDKKKKRKNQRALEFQPVARADRRAKARGPIAEQGREEELFA